MESLPAGEVFCSCENPHGASYRCLNCWNILEKNMNRSGAALEKLVDACERVGDWVEDTRVGEALRFAHEVIDSKDALASQGEKQAVLIVWNGPSEWIRERMAAVERVYGWESSEYREAKWLTLTVDELPQ